MRGSTASGVVTLCIWAPYVRGAISQVPHLQDVGGACSSIASLAASTASCALTLRRGAGDALARARGLRPGLPCLRSGSVLALPSGGCAPG